MKTEDVKILLNTFYKGESDKAQEDTLLRYFMQMEVSPELLDEKDIFLRLYSPKEVEIPADLETNLNSLIDNLSEKSKKTKKIGLWIGSIAASICILLSLGLFINQLQWNKPDNLSSQRMVIEDPEIAYVTTYKALELISNNFNKGLSQLSLINDEMEKTNKILDKTLKR